MVSKILIVDDDLESLKLVGLMLQRRGFEVSAAHNGDQALIKAKTERPDLIILDVMMPGMDGYQVCQQLRATPETAHVPVLMFTAKTLVGDKVAGFQAGADDYLTKPIHPNELVSHVEALLQRVEQAPAAASDTARARIIGVIGAKGGVGTSTLTVNLSVAMHQLLGEDGTASNKEYPVCLVDLQAGWGSVALLMGQQPEKGWGALQRHSASRLNADILGQHLIPHVSGVHYLPASPAPSGEVLPPAELVRRVLDLLDQLAAFVFLDLGNTLNEAASQALRRCDVVLVVVEPEPLCVRMAQELMDRFKRMNLTQDVRVVAVKRFGAEIEQDVAADLEPDGVIDFAPSVVHQAVRQGTPFVLLSPDSAIAGQVRALAQALR